MNLPEETVTEMATDIEAIELDAERGRTLAELARDFPLEQGTLYLGCVDCIIAVEW